MQRLRREEKVGLAWMLAAPLLLSLLAGCERRVGQGSARERGEETGGEPHAPARPRDGPPDAARPRDGGLPLRGPTSWSADRGWSAAERQAGAERRRGALVRALFRDAGVSFPPAELLMRAFKDEGVLEVWAAAEPAEAMRRVAGYRVCMASGSLGPKRREGDGQVPEGFYHVAHFNPQSRFHLSLLVSYPNASDEKLGHPAHPGGEIMIHGDCRSIGCLAMSDERMEELWVMARASKARVQIHLLPSRDIRALLASGAHPEHEAFWKGLDEGLRSFETTRRPPRVRVDADGRYRLSAP